MSAINKIWNGMVNLSPTAKIATSLILKDAVGCYLYVSQARKNKKFTPQQRADVANYDLANGVINIGLQLAAVKPIEKALAYDVGDTVLHIKFGTGVVKSIVKGKNGHEVTVDFPHYGVKKLLSTFANLKKL